MGYRHALEVAGAKVLDYKTTGSYQGTWGAVCQFGGETVLVTGYYGSCSGCDAYQSQFENFDDEPSQGSDGKWYSDWTHMYEISEEQVRDMNEKSRQKLIDFGLSYLRHPLTKDMVQGTIDRFNAKDDGDWSFDTEERELYDWAIKLM